MVEQLNLELLNKQHQIEDLEKELVETNRELCKVLAVEGIETDKNQQIERQEQPANKFLSKPNMATEDRTDLTNELEKVKTSVKTNTPLSDIAQQASKNSKEAIARSKQLQTQYKEIGFQFVSFRANYTTFAERMIQIITKLEQPQDTNNIMYQLLKENHKRLEKNLKQLKAHRVRSNDLLKNSRESIKETQLELKKLQKYNKNLEQVDFCEAKIDLSTPAKQELTSNLSE